MCEIDEQLAVEAFDKVETQEHDRPTLVKGDTLEVGNELLEKLFVKIHDPRSKEGLTLAF